jgi:hypothetical protein
MPIAKSAPSQNVPVQAAPIHQESVLQNMEMAGIPVDVIYRYGLDMGRLDDGETKQLKAITDWMKKDTESLGDGLNKLSILERKLGLGGHDKMLDKVYRWIKLSNHINEIDKVRSSLEKPRWL